MSVKHKQIQELLEELASGSATPGGGSAAALAGAMGAALVSMVCKLTSGKPRFAAVQDELQGVLAEAEFLWRRLADLAEADSRAFDQVMAAYRLPKETPEEQTQRHAAVQSALQQATQVPLETAEACASVVRLAVQVIAKINPSTLSDAGAAALLGEAGLRAAQINVMTNLAAIHDLAFVQAKQQALNALLTDIEQAKERVVAYVVEHA
jgi:formiminotetrahydrofolate cyclodeaminase